MREYTLEKTRNIGIIAHIDAGPSSRFAIWRITTGQALNYIKKR